MFKGCRIRADEIKILDNVFNKTRFQRVSVRSIRFKVSVSVASNEVPAVIVLVENVVLVLDFVLETVR